MNYGKIENRKLKILKMPLKIDGKDVFTTNESIIKENGYKPIEFTEPIEKDGFYPVATYEETETEILQKWDSGNGE